MNQLKIKTISINEEISNSHNKYKLSYSNRSQINEQFQEIINSLGNRASSNEAIQVKNMQSPFKNQNITPLTLNNSELKQD
jgi:histidyl-tRNA synthetase